MYLIIYFPVKVLLKINRLKMTYFRPNPVALSDRQTPRLIKIVVLRLILMLLTLAKCKIAN
jgi:hypothetical protein